jgi:peptidoglycan/LPS O-acetylase OafA/YrhL
VTALTVRPRHTTAAPPLERAARSTTRRDTAVDVARALSLVVVVLLHATMVGVSAPGGLPVIENAMDSWDGFAATTWIVQVMPLFFVLGGFSSFSQWSALRARGVTASAYVALRLRRLLVPSLAVIAATAVVLLSLPALGVPAEVAATAGFRLSQPLWFLGVYILVTALVPALSALHRRRPLATLAVLAALVGCVDLVGITSGIEAVGFLNLLIVWLLVQQTGFLLADGRVDRWSRRRLLALAVAALAALAALCTAGVYSPDLFGNLNPPTGALVLLGLAQLCLFACARPVLRRLHDRAVVAAVVGWINARSMTIYSWHMLVLIGLAGALLASGVRLPEPVSSEWWATRPVWLVTVVLAVALTASIVGRLELRAGTRSRAEDRAGHGWRRVAVATLVAATGVLVVLVAGASPIAWLAATAAIGWVLVGGLAPARHRPAHEHGARRGVLDPLRGAAEQDRLAQPGSAARDDDEVGRELLGGLHDLGRRGAAAHLLDDLRSPAVELGGDERERRVGLAAEVDLDRSTGPLPARPELVRERHGGAGAHDGDDHDLVDLPGVRERLQLAGGGEGLLRSVRGDDDAHDQSFREVEPVAGDRSS